MSFSPPSLQKPYSLISSLDPALNLPADEKEKENAMRVAQETGNWQPLIKAGEQPTVFMMRPLGGTTRNWLIGQQTRHRLTDVELLELVFRLAIEKIENFGLHGSVKRQNLEGHGVATADVLDAIYGIDPANPSLGQQIVIELGGVVLNRLMEGISPKP